MHDVAHTTRQQAEARCSARGSAVAVGSNAIQDALGGSDVSASRRSRSPPPTPASASTGGSDTAASAGASGPPVRPDRTSTSRVSSVLGHLAPATTPPPLLSARWGTTSGRAADKPSAYAGDLTRRSRQGRTDAGGAGIQAKPYGFPPNCANPRYVSTLEGGMRVGREGGFTSTRG